MKFKKTIMAKGIEVTIVTVSESNHLDNLESDWRDSLGKSNLGDNFNNAVSVTRLEGTLLVVTDTGRRLLVLLEV